jgi:glyoxylase-like metal-dependent hydrolase (beta-lactamase superfamily II)
MGNIYRFNVGQFQCTVLADPANTRNAASFWPSLPADEVIREVQAAGYDPGALGNSFNMLFIQTPEHRILVDTGIGAGRSQLIDNLGEIGVQPEAIDQVIITHGHGDHIGGIVGADGKLTFPNAHYTFWKSEWEYWLDWGEKNADPNNPARRNLTPIQDRVNLVDHEVGIFPGVCALHTPGHTIGHMGLLLESNGERLMHIVDAAHHPVQVDHPKWSPHFDYQPDVAAATRKALFERAARENLLVLAYHFPFPGLGHVVERNGALQWEVLKAE